MRRTLIALALAAALFAGCGGDDEEEQTPGGATTEESSGGGGGATLQIAAPEDGSLKFTKSQLTATAGKVTIEFSNPSSIAHAVEIEGNGVEEETETVTGKDAPPITVDLKAGTYEYYCPVDGHKAAGMKGTLTVK